MGREMLRKPRWGHWQQMPQVKVWEALALSCDSDPKQKDDRTFLDDYRSALRYENAARATREMFQGRCDIAESNIEAHILQTVDLVPNSLYRTVELASFVFWAKGLNWAVPSEFSELASRGKLREEFAFDPDSETYPSELDIAFTAWRAASRSPKPTLSPKQQIKQWLRKLQDG